MIMYPEHLGIANYPQFQAVSVVTSTVVHLMSVHVIAFLPRRGSLDAPIRSSKLQLRLAFNFSVLVQRPMSRRSARLATRKAIQLEIAPENEEGDESPTTSSPMENLIMSPPPKRNDAKFLRDTRSQTESAVAEALSAY